MKPWIFLTTGLALSACVSTPNYSLNIPLSEVAAAAASETLADNKVSDRPAFKPNTSDSRTSVTVDVELYDPMPYSGSDLSLTDWRFTLFSHRPISQGLSGYQLDKGYQAALTARDGDVQFRFSAAYLPGMFTPPNNAGLRSLSQFDVSADVSGLWDFGTVHFEVGGRIGLGGLNFRFNQPIQLGHQSFTHDSIGVLYFGLPLGLVTKVGPITFEALLVPTLNIPSEQTDIGFDNDIARSHWSQVISLGAGWQF